MAPYDWPFVGSEALTSGLLRKHQLRAQFRAVFPDVYVHRVRRAWDARAAARLR